MRNEPWGLSNQALFQYPNAVRKQILIWSPSLCPRAYWKSVSAARRCKNTELTRIPQLMNVLKISICGPSGREYWYDVHLVTHERIENQYLRLHRRQILKLGHYLSCPLLTKQLSSLESQGRSLAEVLCTLDASKGSAEYKLRGHEWLRPWLYFPHTSTKIWPSESN